MKINLTIIVILIITVVIRGNCGAKIKRKRKLYSNKLLQCKKCLKHKRKCNKCPALDLLNHLKILSPDETLDEIIYNNKSISRFGDGELDLILGHNIRFQLSNDILTKRLEDILNSNEEGHLIGLHNAWKYENDYFEILKDHAKQFWEYWVNKNKFKLVNLFDLNKLYGSSAISRFYFDYKKDCVNVPNYIKKLKKIWDNKDIVIIEGKKSRLGIGNDLFDNSRSIQRIICPAENAFALYDKILSEASKIDKNRLILIALGPTATILAYDLYKLGYQAIDIGHVDIEYEWFLRNATTKIKIENKYVNEAPNGNANIIDIEDKNYRNQIIATITNENLNKKISIHSNNLPKGFSYCDENNKNGPITTDREKDDGTKRNFFKIVRQENDSFYYDYDNFNNLDNATSIKTEYFCELNSIYRSETLNGYDIICPNHYSIKIDNSFFGRYKNDNKHCKFANNKRFSKRKLKSKRKCGYKPTKYLTELCEGKQYCTIVPTKDFFKNLCGDIPKYLHIEYHCIKNKDFNKEKILIVSFYNGIEVNSIQEHSISEFYQYANIHGYDFQFNDINYMPERSIYFMKFYTLIEKITDGLKYKKYDWIIWVDSDVVFLNPNIKLETFLPSPEMNKVNLIAAFDYLGRSDYCCGLNAGILFIKVNAWSLDILMRAISYPYYNKEAELSLHDQTALNNILIESNESDHYIIVPQQWFNNFHINKGEFLYHVMGGTSEYKNKFFKEFLNKSKNDDDWYSRTNADTRKEVLEYYKLPKENQIKIKLQP